MGAIDHAEALPMELAPTLELSDVSATALATLFARAAESRSTHPILHDRAAEVLVERLTPELAAADTPFYRLLVRNKLPAHLAVYVAMRARHFDRCTRAFLRRNREGVVVNLACGLDTRFQRLNDGRILLYELDFPEVIALKRRLLPRNVRHRYIASSVLEHAWMDRLAPQQEKPLLFLAEGLFMYLPPDEVKALVLALQAHFPGCELLCEVFNQVWLEGWRRALVERKLKQRFSFGEGAMFRFGIRDATDFERWNPGITVLDEWSYVEEEEPKLGLVRLFRNWTLFRHTQWVVHLRLDPPG